MARKEADEILLGIQTNVCCLLYIVNRYHVGNYHIPQLLAGNKTNRITRTLLKVAVKCTFDLITLQCTEQVTVTWPRTMTNQPRDVAHALTTAHSGQARRLPVRTQS